MELTYLQAMMSECAMPTHGLKWHSCRDTAVFRLRHYMIRQFRFLNVIYSYITTHWQRCLVVLITFNLLKCDMVHNAFCFKSCMGHLICFFWKPMCDTMYPPCTSITGHFRFGFVQSHPSCFIQPEVTSCHILSHPTWPHRQTPFTWIQPNRQSHTMISDQFTLKLRDKRNKGKWSDRMLQVETWHSFVIMPLCCQPTCFHNMHCAASDHTNVC